MRAVLEEVLHQESLTLLGVCARIWWTRVLDFTERQFGFTGGRRNGSEAAETDGVEGAIVIATMRIISVGVHGTAPNLNLRMEELKS
jgi:hypothetical protein